MPLGHVSAFSNFGSSHRVRESVATAMADSVKMWWLKLGNHERLLAVFCDDSRSEPFKQAKSYCSTQLHLEGKVEKSVFCESSEDVGVRGWSSRIRNVKLCFEELPQYQEQHLVAASARGIAAIGIGRCKEKRLRAAYLSLALTSAIQQLGSSQDSNAIEALPLVYSNAIEALPQTRQILVRACLEAPSLTAAPVLLAGTRLFFLADPSKAVLQYVKGYTVVWHIQPGFQNCAFERYVKKSDAEARFRDFRNGPYNTILFDQDGEALLHYGKWAFEMRAFEMRAFWQTVTGEGTFEPSKDGLLEKSTHLWKKLQAPESNAHVDEQNDVGGNTRARSRTPPRLKIQACSAHAEQAADERQPRSPTHISSQSPSQVEDQSRRACPSCGLFTATKFCGDCGTRVAPVAFDSLDFSASAACREANEIQLKARDDDVEIGQMMDQCGNRLSLDGAFRRIRMSSGIECGCVGTRPQRSFKQDSRKMAVCVIKTMQRQYNFDQDSIHGRTIDDWWLLELSSQ